ncbi:MAG: glutamate 5-kinase [Sulfurovum sp.]|nr:glutamate 5-kinase [Sulfurovum sp.]
MAKKRIVLKVGSYVLTHNEGIAKERMLELVKFIVMLKREDIEVILVSSGAISAGYSKLKIDKSDTINRQVLASIGQTYLLSTYQDFFDNFDMICSQILLPYSIFDSQIGRENANNTINRLLSYNITPIINENDTVSIEELLEGDNDMLSAYITHFCDADMLIILSNLDAYVKDGKAIKVEDNIPQDEKNTKIEAGRFVVSHHKQMFLASGFDLSDAKSFLLDDIHKGGTLFYLIGTQGFHSGFSKTLGYPSSISIG